MKTMRARLAQRLADSLDAIERGHVDLAIDAILDEMLEPENDILAAGYEAMFEDKWDGTQAPMMGAGWQAMINQARKEAI